MIILHSSRYFIDELAMFLKDAFMIFGSYYMASIYLEGNMFSKSQNHALFVKTRVL